MKNSVFSVLLFFFFLSCEKNPFEKVPVNGTWVETTQKLDTLVFAKHVCNFTLNRGTELRNGYLLPKYSSGIYSYEIEKDSILLQWMLSSSMHWNTYYFKKDLEKDEISIGNFFEDSLNTNAILTFSRAQ